MTELTEAQIRQVIREELEQFLLEEGIMNLRTGMFKKIGLPAILIATILNAAVPTQPAAGMANGPGGPSPVPTQQVKPQSIQELIDEAGMTPEILSDLTSELSKEDIAKLQSLFQQIKQKQEQINKARKENASEEEIKELEKEKNNIFSATNIKEQEQLDRIMATGGAILRYIESANPEELEGIGDVNDKEALLKLKAKALKFNLSSKGRSTLLANNATQDLIAAKNVALENDRTISQNPNVRSNFDIALVYTLGKYGNEALDTFGDVITPIEVIKFLGNKGEIDSQLLKNFKEQTIDEYSAGLEDDPNYSISKDDASKMASGLQENKVNKLRQRLNELRGVYV